MSLNTIVKFAMTLTLAASVSFADLLTKELSGKENSGVKLSKAASVKVDQYNVNLTQVGAGLRTKKVLVANVKVYTAEVFVSEANVVVKKDAELLSSVASAKTAVVQLTFLRDVEADKVQVSFRDALIANNIDINSDEVTKLFSFMVAGGEAKNGKTMTFVTNKNSDGTETLYFEDTKGVVNSVVGKELTKKIFSMWLGIPADDGLKKLKEELLK
ncbi:MAG: chalcone isomerase family protein [Bdellovibrionaceae bacterium]|jgi:hypothetical protein|nr:chalcone isomerase family protein [Pseudobdellovibrionaceae bacterium]